MDPKTGKVEICQVLLALTEVADYKRELDENFILLPGPIFEIQALPG